jgi:hypothetical protein
MTMTETELRQLGYRVVDGKAVRVRKAEGLSVPAEKSGDAMSAPYGKDPGRPNGKARTGQPTSTPSAPSAPYRSKWEAERAQILEVQKRGGMIRDWRYEAVRLKLADGAWYKSDFVVRHNDGGIELEEVKGYWREAARVRWKVAIENYGAYFDFSLWTKQGGAWVRTEYHDRGAA